MTGKDIRIRTNYKLYSKISSMMRFFRIKVFYAEVLRNNVT